MQNTIEKKRKKNLLENYNKFIYMMHFYHFPFTSPVYSQLTKKFQEGEMQLLAMGKRML